VRDTALAVSGLLVRKIGGPSVYPYQPPGLGKSSIRVTIRGNGPRNFSSRATVRIFIGAHSILFGSGRRHLRRCLLRCAPIVKPAPQAVNGPIRHCRHWSPPTRERLC
jgi:hypothetical protein